MPDREFPKLRPHPARSSTPCTPRRRSDQYAELIATSNFTFLHGGSHPEELVERASELGYHAVALTDTNSLAGIVRAHVQARRCGIPLVVGCRLTPSDGPPVCLYPTDRPAYSRLCRLLTIGKRRAPKGQCHSTLHDIFEHAEGMLAVIEPPETINDQTIESIAGLRRAFEEGSVSIASWRAYAQDDDRVLDRIHDLCVHTGLPMVAVNRALYHTPDRRPLQDVLTCIRSGCTIEEAGFRLEANAERHLKEPEEMRRAFARFPEAIDRAIEVADRASSFSLDELRYEYPAEATPQGITPTQYLRRLAYEGAAQRYKGPVPEKTQRAMEHELCLIQELGYEPYFLTCYDIVRFARARDILCQGRGGAANSAVCYCLGITEVDPSRFQLLFERFVSRERNEPPDIDIDFEHERREEVLQYIYEKYGREHAALTAVVISYRGRSAIREVGKAMGLSDDCVDALAKNLDRWGESASDERTREAGLDPSNPVIRRVIDLSRELIGFPRHLSQHVGGFVITRSPLCELVPIENASMDDRTVIEWDKDDIDAMGMLKIDCLGLGMLTCIRKAFELLEEIGVEAEAGGRLTIADVMANEASDDAVYAMISRADTLGVFQIESRAQMSMLPRLKPRCFCDLVIEVAIVRPGPIQGGMVHPYLRRREGKEAVHYPSEEIRETLERTLGVPLFQEQAMQLAIVAAGFSADQADGLRRSMAAWKRKGNAIYEYGKQLIDGMIARGYPKDFAERCFEQIKGFSEYGFPESHAASFAILVYVSAWLKHYHPAAFAAALINSQPMGFYQPAQIVRDAQEHGVEIRPVDVNHSRWNCTLEESGTAIRLGMRMVKGLPEADAQRIESAVRRCGQFGSVESLWRASSASVRALRCLAQADAFRSMGLDRQTALWEIKPLKDTPMPLFEEQSEPNEPAPNRLPCVSDAEQVLHDYGAVGLSLKAHPVSFLRPRLDRLGVIPSVRMRNERAFPSKRKVTVAGLVLCRQRPSTASGVTFITLEDETGIVNLIVWRDVFERYRKPARLSTILLAQGVVERAGEVIHVHAHHLEQFDHHMPSLISMSRDFQ